MKKVTKIVTLVATGLCALALVPATTAAIVGSMNAAEASNDIHMISYVNDREVMVAASYSARAGQVVDVTLTYDAEAYRVLGLLVDDENLAVQYDNYHFSFVMPDHDAKVEVYGERALMVGKDVFVPINLAEEQGVVLNYLSSYAMPGDAVYFSVGSLPYSPYQVTGYVEAFTLIVKGEQMYVGQPIQLTQIGVDTYGFIMPDAHVGIYAETELKGYVATFNETNNIEKIETSLDGETWKVAPLVSLEKNFEVFIQATSLVRVTLKDTLQKTPNGLTIGDKTLLLGEGEKVLTFAMPMEDIDVTVDVSEILYKIIISDDEVTQHYNWTMYRSDKSDGEYKEVTDGACYQEYVKLYPTLKPEFSGRKIGGVGYCYEGMSGTYSTTSGTDDLGAFYRFNLGQGKDYTIKVTTEYVAKQLSITNTDHITAKFVEKVDGKWVEKANEFYAGEYVYIQFEAEKGYKVKNPRFDYKYSSGSSSYANCSVNDAANNVYRSSTTIQDSYKDYVLSWQEITGLAVNFENNGDFEYKVVAKDSNSNWVEIDPIGYYGDYVYIQLINKLDPEEYAFKQLTVKYGSSSVSVYVEDSTNNVYRFTMPNSAVTVAAEKTSTSAYKGYGFAKGQYFGAELYAQNYFGSSSARACSDYNSFFMDGSGSGKFGGSTTVEILSVTDGSTKDNGAACIKYGTSSYASAPLMAYGKDGVIIAYTKSHNLYYTHDFYVEVPCVADGDKSTDYSFRGYSTVPSYQSDSSKKGWSIIEAMRKGEHVSYMFIDKTTGTNVFYLSDVTVQFTGSSQIVYSASAQYDIFVGGVKLGSVNGTTFTKA